MIRVSGSAEELPQRASGRLSRGSTADPAADAALPNGLHVAQQTRQGVKESPCFSDSVSSASSCHEGHSTSSDPSPPANLVSEAGGGPIRQL